MGVGRIFPRRDTRGFSKIFPGVAKSDEICFFPLKTKKATFFAKIFKIQGAFPPCPSLSHDHASHISFIHWEILDAY